MLKFENFDLGYTGRMKLYRFSPIQTKEQLLEAAVYVAEQNAALCKKVIGETLPMTSLTVFAHYPEEYAFLCDLLANMGESVGGNNGPRIRLHEPITAAGQTITHLRIRNPDPYRAQVGCGDFDVSDYAAFKNRQLNAHPSNLRLLVRPDYELIEFFDPDFDVLAYVLSEPDRSTHGK